MAFRVCCSCKTPLGPSEGFVSRLCRVTQTLGTVIGTESYFWTPVSGYSDKWEMSFTAPSTGNFLLEGFRVEWYGPTANGQKFNGLYPFADTNVISDLYEYIPKWYLNHVNSVGTANKTQSSWTPGGLPHMPFANLLNTKVPLGGHVSNESLRGISFAWNGGNEERVQFIRKNDTAYASLPEDCRVKYWRLLANGQPDSDIIPGYHPDSRTSQTMYPDGDISTTGWNTSSGTDFYSLVDEDVAAHNPADYVWSDVGTTTLILSLSDFTYTGGYNFVTLNTRVSVVNSSGTLTISGGVAYTATLQYEGQDIGQTAFTVTGNGSSFSTITTNFRPMGFIGTLTRESSSFIPLNADPTKFRVKFSGNSLAERRIAFSAINVTCEAFAYKLDTDQFSNNQPYWPIETAYRIPWRKNVRLGFDIWLEAVKTSGQSFTASLGRVNQSSGKFEGLYADCAHGTMGIRTTFVPEYDRNEFGFYVKFLNGTWRPSQLDVGSSDTVTFGASNFRNDDINNRGFRKQVGSNSADGVQLLMNLQFNQEIPEVVIGPANFSSSFSINGVSRLKMRYLPEDTGHAITNFYFYHGSTLGNVYVNSQSPGGVWKHKKVTKFVLERPVQTLTTNFFSPEELISLSGFPTEIEVGPAYPPQTYSFWEDTEWECPSNVSSVTVRCWGGGGGGGATDDYSGSAAGGGGGGAFSSKVVSVTPGTTYTITVGAGGAGGVDGNINGQAGGDSWFVDAGTVMAKGGSGGTGALLDDDEAGGAGGASASGVGTTRFSGGAGADGSAGNYGGGGGASAGTNNNGAAATNATGATGTNSGGNGGTGTTATAGGLPGGGGGGAKGTASSDTILPGGAGGGGLVTLRY